MGAQSVVEYLIDRWTTCTCKNCISKVGNMYESLVGVIICSDESLEMLDKFSYLDIISIGRWSWLGSIVAGRNSQNFCVYWQSKG